MIVSKKIARASYLNDLSIKFEVILSNSANAIIYLDIFDQGLIVLNLPLAA